MNNKEKPAFVTVINALAATFGREPSEPLLLGYWMGLEDLDIHTVEVAAAKAMRTCKFMPTVAELRELGGELQPADRAALAWEAFAKALQLHGCYTSVDFDDKLINATVRNLGGWVKLNERLEQDGETWVRKDFERVYGTFMRSGASTSQALPLGGLHEQSNAGNGYDVTPPVLIETGLPGHAAGLIEVRPLVPRIEEVAAVANQLALPE